MRMLAPTHQSKLRGVLLGTALGDALGLPMEGLNAKTIQKRFGRTDRFRLWPNLGIVSDDTEQSALLAQSILRAGAAPEMIPMYFRRSLVGWFLRLPWGIGMATVKASFRSLVGIRPSGVPSAGNGAAMRAAVLGVNYYQNTELLLQVVQSTSVVTHTDERALAGASFVALLAAQCTALSTSDLDARLVAFTSALERMSPDCELLKNALTAARTLAFEHAPVPVAAQKLGTSGYVIHTVPFALFCFLRFGETPLVALQEAISAGGDTDSIAAILGGWIGALHGEEGLPEDLTGKLAGGPFGRSHLESLADALAAQASGEEFSIPRWSPAVAMFRNLVLFPLILAHGFRRLLPF